MVKDKKGSLMEARKKGQNALEKFIREHEKDDAGDMEKLDKALNRPASDKTKQAPKTSSQVDSDD